MPKKKPNSKADLCGQSAGPRKEPTDSIPEPMQSRHAEEMARLETACREGSIPAGSRTSAFHSKFALHCLAIGYEESEMISSAENQ